MLFYTVLTGTEKFAILADTSLTNKHLIQHCFQLFDMDKKLIVIRSHVLINWVPNTVGRECRSNLVFRKNKGQPDSGNRGLNLQGLFDNGRQIKEGTPILGKQNCSIFDNDL